MNLGKLTVALAELDKDMSIRFDDGSPVGHLASWRGDYRLLTITTGYKNHTAETVGDLLADAIAADGAIFQGYKGGDYTMDCGIAVYADDWGDYNSLMITGITVSDGVAVIGRFDSSDY